MRPPTGTGPRHDDLVVVVDHPQQHLVLGRVRPAVERHDRLREQAEPSPLQCLEEVAEDVQVLVALHQAGVGRGEDFDAVAAAVLGRGAGHLGVRERVAEPFTGGECGDAKS